jgi:hypothetical protein
MRQLNLGAVAPHHGLMQASFPARSFSTTKPEADDIPDPPKKRGRPRKVPLAEGETPPTPAPRKRAKKAEKLPSTNIGPLRKMYVMKFNSPILPFAKFPLTQNKYIQDFLKQYEKDKLEVDTVIGVHFPQNNNKMAPEQVGVEIKITKKNNLTIIESLNTRRYQIKNYDSETNFADAQEFTDLTLNQTFGKSEEGADLNPKDLLSSELFELK